MADLHALDDHADLLGPDDIAQLLTHHSQVLQQIASGTPLPQVLDGITVALEQLISGSRCSILLLAPDGATLQHGAAPSLPAEYSAEVDGIALGPTAGSCGTAAHSGVRVIAADITSDDRWDDFRALALPHGLRSCWSTPILGASEQVVGTFAVYHDYPHTPDRRELQLVDRFTYLAAVAIDHAALYGALADSEEQFRRLFDDNAVGMALIGLDGRLGRTNDALEHALDRDAADLDGVRFESVLDTGSVRPWQEAWSAVVSGETESTSLQVDLIATHGRALTVMATLSMVRGHRDLPRFVSLNALDVTARLVALEDRRARREADIARSTAEAASRAKSEFLTTFGHELRSPLQAIIGFTELFGTLELDDVRRREALGHITGATSQLLAMVDDVLDVSRLEAGRLPVSLADTAIGAVAREAAELLRPLADRRSITLDCDGSLDVSAWTDARRLRQVLINLISNAVRYGAERGTISLRCEPIEADTVTIVVHDNGPGIPADLLDRLFVPFDTLGAEGKDGTGPGVGVGLIVAQGLCEATGGALTLTSDPGQGTTARVTLPLAEPCRSGGGSGESRVVGRTQRPPAAE
ncbi:GAF domain-containing sensor histidine kinase [Kribbella italica]|uniref:histidine kinase n=1 Tax=Kribbella italica TaxID=1540520 RepID=A0A7W9J5V1_9ACTN|nr:GAF domain-containing sensor histidine kinase [Kribbella italica]MBB5835662.1 PAS domain S-box-containing protein [Kribbella italica]